jgi:hypothetical protein
MDDRNTTLWMDPLINGRLALYDQFMVNVQDAIFGEKEGRDAQQASRPSPSHILPFPVTSSLGVRRRETH